MDLAGVKPLSLLDLDQRSPSSCDDLATCRTVWDIIMVCFVTVFACSWIAIHPNASYPVNKQWMSICERYLYYIRIFLVEKMPLFILVLIFPEFVLAHAIQQRLVADSLAKRDRTTRRSAFFVIMGGIYHYDEANGEPCCMIPPHMLNYQLQPSVTNLSVLKEVEDKSKDKGEPLTIFLVVFQVSWFLIQCIARANESMHVTKIEILTIAYINMNMWIYLAWKDKPRKVGRPIRVSSPHQRPSKYKSGWVFSTDKICKIVLGYRDYYLDWNQMIKAPMFYSGSWDVSDVIISDGIALLIGASFAGINCIAWLYDSHSFMEQVLWRSYSLAILGFYIVAIIIFPPYCIDVNGIRSRIATWIIAGMLVLCVLFYISARVGLIVLSLMDLRSLPPTAYETVYWTTLIPHI